MPFSVFEVIASASVSSAIACAVTSLLWGKRVKALQRDLRGITEAICQLADSQMGLRKKLSAAVEEMEEKILDVAVPSRDTGRNLDRRHRVLSLARRGLAVDDIARQLKVPRGEAELILSLKKYMEKGAAQAASEASQP